MSTRCSDEGERTVTALFQDARQAEQAYEAALALGYDKSEINLVMSEDTRERLASDPRHAEAAQAADSQVRPKDLGGPIGGAAGTLAPVLAAVGTLVLAPGLVLVGPIAAALAAAGAVAVAGGLVGVLNNWGVPDERIQQYEAGIRQGGIFLGVKTHSTEHARELERNWKNNGGQLVHC
ncbi:MAG TPA: hypothetical protein VF193_06425 [Steroidobacter sp.]